MCLNVTYIAYTQNTELCVSQRVESNYLRTRAMLVNNNSQVCWSQWEKPKDRWELEKGLTVSDRLACAMIVKTTEMTGWFLKSCDISGI